jgi:hypothetical protein
MILEELQVLADKLAAYQQTQPIGFVFDFYTERAGSLRLDLPHLEAGKLGWLTGNDMPNEGFRSGGGAVKFDSAYFATPSPRLAAALALEPIETGILPGEWLTKVTPPPQPKLRETGKKG